MIGWLTEATGHNPNMVHATFTTAVDDLLIHRNLRRIKGAGQDKADERASHADLPAL